MKLVKVKTAQKAVKKRKTTRLETALWVLALGGMIFYFCNQLPKAVIDYNDSLGISDFQEVQNIEVVAPVKKEEGEKAETPTPSPRSFAKNSKNNTTPEKQTAISLTPLDGSGKVYSIGEQQAMTFKSPFSGVKQAPEKQTWKSPFSGFPKPTNTPKMADREVYNKAFHLLLMGEGGYSPCDPGNGRPVNMGVNQQYYRRLKGYPRNVKDLTRQQVFNYYYQLYWSPLKLSKKGYSVRYQCLLFDTAVQFGVGGARELERASRGDVHKAIRHKRGMVWRQRHWPKSIKRAVLAHRVDNWATRTV